MNFAPDFENAAGGEQPEQDKGNIEAQVNFECNDTQLLLGRLRDSVIKEQLIDTQLEAELKSWRFFRKEEWEPYKPDDPDEESEFDLLEGAESGDIISREDLQELLDESKPTRDEIAKELDKRIKEAAHSTDIEYSQGQPGVHAIPLNFKLPWTGKEPTSKQMSIIEAHEKGHKIRHYEDLTDEFIRGFDVSEVEFTQDFRDMLNRMEEQDHEAYEDTADLSLEEMRDEYLNNYLFTANEIVERMSQLKNYFGIDGSETFTKEHLHYAQENYIADTGMDNAMSLFFQGITDETEGEFLELINSMGV